MLTVSIRYVFYSAFAYSPLFSTENVINRITAIRPGKKRQKNAPLWPLGSKRIAIPRRASNSRRKASAHAIASAVTRIRTQDESLAIL